SLQFGQGLAMWNGFSMGKGAFIQNIARQEFGLRSYTSSNESRYLRGVATAFQFKKLQITPFFSYKKLDAPLSKDSSSFSSIAISGYHRTPAELRNRGSVSNALYGLNLFYNTGNLKV